MPRNHFKGWVENAFYLYGLLSATRSIIDHKQMITCQAPGTHD